MNALHNSDWLAVVGILIGLVGTTASTAAVIILGNVRDSVKSVSDRVAKIEGVLFERALNPASTRPRA